MKKISIILTTYNGAAVIDSTIQSILSQEGVNKDFEIDLIVVDDCSTDGTTQILEKRGIAYECTEKNSGGPNKGRNIGLLKAVGDFICIADQDDIWKADRIKTILPFLDKAPIISSGYTIVNRTTGKSIERINKAATNYIHYHANETFKNKISRSLMGQNTYLGSIFFSKDLKNILFEEDYGMVDFDWVLRLFHQNSSIEVCKSLYERNINGSNLSLDETYRKKDFDYTLLTLKKYQNQYPQHVAIGHKKTYGSMARYYYLMGDMNKAREYFKHAQLDIKTILYYITTFFGSKFVKKKFNVFG